MVKSEMQTEADKCILALKWAFLFFLSGLSSVEKRFLVLFKLPGFLDGSLIPTVAVCEQMHLLQDVLYVWEGHYVKTRPVYW